MARAIPENRFSELVRVATRVFIERGYRLTQMADVSAALGVSKGTIYGYVESKEALFELCLRSAGAETSVVERPSVLPLPTPRPGALKRLLRSAIRERGRQPALRGALERDRAPPSPDSPD